MGKSKDIAEKLQKDMEVVQREKAQLASEMERMRRDKQFALTEMERMQIRLKAAESARPSPSAYGQLSNAAYHVESNSLREEARTREINVLRNELADLHAKHDNLKRKLPQALEGCRQMVKMADTIAVLKAQNDAYRDDFFMEQMEKNRLQCMVRDGTNSKLRINNALLSLRESVKLLEGGYENDLDVDCVDGGGVGSNRDQQIPNLPSAPDLSNLETYMPDQNAIENCTRLIAEFSID